MASAAGRERIGLIGTDMRSEPKMELRDAVLLNTPRDAATASCTLKSQLGSALSTSLCFLSPDCAPDGQFARVALGQRFLHHSRCSYISAT